MVLDMTTVALKAVTMANRTLTVPQAIRNVGVQDISELGSYGTGIVFDLDEGPVGRSAVHARWFRQAAQAGPSIGPDSRLRLRVATISAPSRMSSKAVPSSSE